MSMKLLRLLSTGRSLVGLKDTGNRYRPSSKGALPVFPPVRHSFRKTAPSKSQAPDTALTTACEPSAGLSTAQVESSESGVSDQLQQNLPDAVSPPTNTPQRGVESDGHRVGCDRPSPVGGGNGDRLDSGWFSWWPFRRKRPSGIPPLPKKPVPLQGELSLDNVKVVRNDLRDSDIDLVPAGSVKREQKTGQVNTERHPSASNARCI